MEASAALQLILDLHSKGVGVEFIVSDDDSTMRAHLTHVGADKGKLPLHVPEPKFLCDPSHRIKVMVKDIFGLALMSKKKSECEKIDALRLKKYLGCWVGKSKLLPFDEFKNWQTHQLNTCSGVTNGVTLHGDMQSKLIRRDKHTTLQQQ